LDRAYNGTPPLELGLKFISPRTRCAGPGP